MVELRKVVDLPSEIVVEGKSYKIKTDYQNFINFSLMLQEQHSYYDYDVMYKYDKPDNRVAGLEELKKFAFPKAELPRDMGEETDAIILDYALDEDYIYCAFYQCYGIDLKDTELHLHWYKFRALLNGIIDTKLNKIMEARSYVPNKNDNAEYRKYMLSTKAKWQIERKFTEEEQEAIDKFDALLK